MNDSNEKTEIGNIDAKKKAAQKIARVLVFEKPAPYLLELAQAYQVAPHKFGVLIQEVGEGVTADLSNVTSNGIEVIEAKSFADFVKGLALFHANQVSRFALKAMLKSPSRAAEFERNVNEIGREITAELQKGEAMLIALASTEIARIVIFSETERPRVANTNDTVNRIAERIKELNIPPQLLDFLA